MTNKIMVIHPYKTNGMWLFDDLAVGLRQEPFISGADKIIEAMVEEIPDAENGFTLLFSDSPFPCYALELFWEKMEYGGNWYYSPELEMKGWLCAAIFLYFTTLPKKIYVKFIEKENSHD